MNGGIDAAVAKQMAQDIDVKEKHWAEQITIQHEREVAEYRAQLDQQAQLWRHQSQYGIWHEPYGMVVCGPMAYGMVVPWHFKGWPMAHGLWPMADGVWFRA